MTRRYTAVAQRSGGWWAIHVPEVPGVFTQARTLREGRGMARSALSLALDTPPDTFEVALTVAVDDRDADRLRGGVTGLLAEVAEKHRVAEEATIAAADATRDAAAALRLAGLTLADTGELLGVSYQRVQQLLAERHHTPAATRRGRRGTPPVFARGSGAQAM